MGSKKGQLFLVTIVFLIGLLFIIHQALFQYSKIDMAEPFEERSDDIMENILLSVNNTIKNTYYCNQTEDNFEKRMKELKVSMLDDFGRSFNPEISYTINCSNWWSPSPPSPMILTLSVSTFGKETRGTFEFYHNQ